MLFVSAPLASLAADSIKSKSSHNSDSQPEPEGASTEQQEKQAEDQAGAEVGEIDLRENPDSPSGGPSAPVYEEWYHGKISRKQVSQCFISLIF